MPIDWDDIKDRIPKELRDKIQAIAGKKKRVMKKEVFPEMPAALAPDPDRPSEWKKCKKHGLSWVGDWPCVYCEEK